MAGLSVAAVALPVGLAYAAMMGVPPVAGLWAAIAGMLGYAVFGSSRTLIVGPDTATCTLIAATLTGMALTDPQDRLVAATGIALTVGVGCLIARVLRLGVLANLLSRPVLIGYMAGVAITLALSQLSGLTGVGLRNSGLIHPFLELSRRLPEIRIPTLALGLGSCLLLIAVKRWRPNWPGPILLVVGACAASWAFDFPGMGIAVVGEVPAGLPALSLPVRLDGVDDMLLGAAGVLVVSFSSGIVTARSFAARSGEHIDPNRELVGFGAANVAAGLFQGFVVTGADSRTAVGLVAGGSSPLVSISAAAALAVVVGLLSGPLYWLPQAVLSAILLLAAASLFDGHAFMRLARISRVELAFGVLAAVGVVGFGVLQGVAVSVGATLLYAMYVGQPARCAAGPPARRVGAGQVAPESGGAARARHGHLAVRIAGMVLQRRRVPAARARDHGPGRRRAMVRAGRRGHDPGRRRRGRGAVRAQARAGRARHDPVGGGRARPVPHRAGALGPGEEDRPGQDLRQPGTGGGRHRALAPAGAGHAGLAETDGRSRASGPSLANAWRACPHAGALAGSAH